MSDREKLIEKAEDILEKWEFFYGQRAGRELWAEKPKEVQDEDIEAFCRDISVVRSAISNGATLQKWIPVSERLPDNSEHDWVLAQVVEENGYMHIPKVMEYRQNRNDWFEETYGWLSEHKGAFIVTHWMPLPEPAKECE